MASVSTVLAVASSRSIGCGLMIAQRWPLIKGRPSGLLGYRSPGTML
jgi:hypothetical protein